MAPLCAPSGQRLTIPRIVAMCLGPDLGRWGMLRAGTLGTWRSRSASFPISVYRRSLARGKSFWRAYRYTPVLGDGVDGPRFESLREAKAWAIKNVAYPRALRDGYGYLFGD